MMIEELQVETKFKLILDCPCAWSTCVTSQVHVSSVFNLNDHQVIESLTRTVTLSWQDGRLGAWASMA